MITTIKQHTFKNGSIKTITQDDYDGHFDAVYRVTMLDSDNISQCDQTFQYLKSALELYNSIAINYNNERFMTKAGRLTLYALVCGYREEYTFPDGSYKDLWQESACIHVRHIKQDGRIWETFNINELTKARKFYASISL